MPTTTLPPTPYAAPVYPPPLPAPEPSVERLGPQQVFLGVGAVLVVAAGGASLAAVGEGGGLVVLGGLAAAATLGSLRAARRGLRATEETLAAAAAALLYLLVRGLSLLPGDGTPWDGGTAAALAYAGLAGVLAALGVLSRSTVSWPIAAWGAAQLGVATWLLGSRFAPPVPAVLLATAVAGLVLALRGRRQVALTGLVTALPWWVLGVVTGLRTAWGDTGMASVLSAVLLVVAALALAATEYRAPLRPWLGPRLVVPVLGGAVAGAGVAGALHAAGPAGVGVAGVSGQLLAVVVASLATRRRISVFRPLGLTAATTLTGCSVVELVATGRWGSLSLLLAVSAVIAGVVAALQPADRSGALALTVGCLAGAIGLLDPAGTLSRPVTSAVLLVLALLTLAAAHRVTGDDEERPLALTSGAVAVVALLLVLSLGAWGGLAVELVVWGVALLVHGDLSDRGASRWLGAASLVAGSWTAAVAEGLTTVEAYSLPAAVALLAGHGRRLGSGASWPTWEPGLTVAAAPTVLLAIADPTLLRVALLVAVAVLAMTAGVGWRVQAPLVVGSSSLLVLSAGLLVVALPWPALLVLAVAGGVLLVAGAGYEDRVRRAREVVAHLDQLR